MFTKNERLPELLDKLKEGAFIKMKAVAMMDQFEHDIALGSVSGIRDHSGFHGETHGSQPRLSVELHCHDHHGDMDGVTDVKKLLKTAMDGDIRPWPLQIMALFRLSPMPITV